MCGRRRAAGLPSPGGVASAFIRHATLYRRRASRNMSESRTLSETILLASISAVGYACAFAYEVGFANAYGIPRELVTISLTSVFLAIFGVMLSLLMFYNILDMLAGVAGLTRHPVVLYFRVPIALTVMAAPFAILLGRHLWELTAQLYVFIGLCFALWIVFPLVMFRQVPGYLNKLKASEDADAAALSKTITNLVTSSVPTGRSLGAVAAFLLIALSYAYGAGEAANRSVYWVRLGNPEFVVLRIYGDRAVLARLDRATRTIAADYRVVAFADATVAYTRQKFVDLRLPIEPPIRAAEALHK